MKTEDASKKPDDKVKYHYFLDGKKIDTDTSSLSGSDIRAQLPPEKAGYPIFLESQGNEPDKQINDGDNFSLEKKPLRFYSVPPANFGRQ